MQNVDLAPERYKWCSCPALTELAGEKVYREQELFISIKSLPEAFPSTRERGKSISERGVSRPEEGGWHMAQALPCVILT